MKKINGNMINVYCLTYYKLMLEDKVLELSKQYESKSGNIKDIDLSKVKFYITDELSILIDIVPESIDVDKFLNMLECSIGCILNDKYKTDDTNIKHKQKTDRIIKEIEEQEEDSIIDLKYNFNSIYN